MTLVSVSHNKCRAFYQHVSEAPQCAVYHLSSQIDSSSSSSPSRGKETLRGPSSRRSRVLRERLQRWCNQYILPTTPNTLKAPGLGRELLLNSASCGHSDSGAPTGISSFNTPLLGGWKRALAPPGDSTPLPSPIYLASSSGRDLLFCL